MSTKRSGPGVWAEVGLAFVHCEEQEHIALFLVVTHFSSEIPIALSAQEGRPKPQEVKVVRLLPNP